MNGDLKREVALAFRHGWDACRRHTSDAGTDWHRARAEAIFLARYELDPDEETRRLVEGALRCEQ